MQRCSIKNIVSLVPTVTRRHFCVLKNIPSYHQSWWNGSFPEKKLLVANENRREKGQLFFQPSKHFMQELKLSSIFLSLLFNVKQLDELYFCDGVTHNDVVINAVVKVKQFFSFCVEVGKWYHSRVFSSIIYYLRGSPIYDFHNFFCNFTIPKLNMRTCLICRRYSHTWRVSISWQH